MQLAHVGDSTTEDKSTFVTLFHLYTGSDGIIPCAKIQGKHILLYIHYSEAPAQTNLISTLATKIPTNGEKHKTNGPSNSRYALWK